NSSAGFEVWAGAARETPRTLSSLNVIVLQFEEPCIRTYILSPLAECRRCSRVLRSCCRGHRRNWYPLLLCLSSRDLHGFGPGALAFADHERVTRMASHLKHVLFVRLPTLHGP